MIIIAAAQMRVSRDREENVRKSVDFIEKAAAAGAQLVCFPEGQLGYYAPQYPDLAADDIAVTIDDPCIQTLRAACRENSIIAVIAHNFIIDGKIYASMMIISEKGEILGIQKKNHIVCAPHYYEQHYFTPGDEGYNVVETSVGRIGMIVCFDRHFPESFRTCVLKGADLIIVPVANDKSEPLEIFRWEIRIPAYQNGVNAVMINRVGVEGEMDFCGETMAVNYDGSIAAIADDSEQLLTAEFDTEGAREFRKEKQYVSLMRPEIFAYGQSGTTE